jgi:AraC family transcriptional regulator
VRPKSSKNERRGIFMEPKIIFDKEFKVVGLKKLVKPLSDAIPDLWGHFFSRRDEIKNDVEPDVALGVCEYMPDVTDDSEINYYACVEVTDFKSIPEGMTAKTIPPSKYAVFTHKGSMAGLKSTYDFIYDSWLPNSGHKLAESDTIELYDSRSIDISSPDCEFDIYIPLN